MNPRMAMDGIAWSMMPTEPFNAGRDAEQNHAVLIRLVHNRQFARRFANHPRAHRPHPCLVRPSNKGDGFASGAPRTVGAQAQPRMPVRVRPAVHALSSSSNLKPIFCRPSTAVLPYSFSISLAKLGA